MSNSRYQRLTEWIQRKSHSTPAQWLASIATGCGMAYTSHFFIGLVLPDASTSIGTILMVANEITAAVIFLLATKISREEIYKNVKSHPKLDANVAALHTQLASTREKILRSRKHLSSMADILKKITVNSTLDERTTREINLLQEAIADEINSHPRFVAIGIQDAPEEKQRESHEPDVPKTRADELLQPLLKL